MLFEGWFVNHHCQAVETFKKERGYTKSLARGCGASQSQNPTPAASPVPTAPHLGVPSQPQKPHLSTQQVILLMMRFIFGCRNKLRCTCVTQRQTQ